MKFCFQSELIDLEGVAESDHIYREICDNRTFYEIDLLEYILSLRPFFGNEKATFLAIDVGANIGNHSVFLARFVVDEVVAIEPNPAVLSNLQRNLDVNNACYSIVPYAVGADDGSATIGEAPGIENNVGASRLAFNDGDGDIKVSTLDAVVSSHLTNKREQNRIAIIKVDVEGMELAVFKGADNTLRDFRPQLLFEAETQARRREIAEYLRSFGYKRIPGSWASTPVYHYAYRPGPAVYLNAFRMTIYKWIKRIRKKMIRFLCRLGEE